MEFDPQVKTDRDLPAQPDRSQVISYRTSVLILGYLVGVGTMLFGGSPSSCRPLSVDRLWCSTPAHPGHGIQHDLPPQADTKNFGFLTSSRIGYIIPSLPPLGSVPAPVYTHIRSAFHLSAVIIIYSRYCIIYIYDTLYITNNATPPSTRLCGPCYRRYYSVPVDETGHHPRRNLRCSEQWKRKRVRILLDYGQSAFKI